MIKEYEETRIKCAIAAKECGLTLNDEGTKYLKPVYGDANTDKRHYCNVKDWQPQRFWSHLMYMASNCEALKKMVVIPAEKPKEVFEIAMNLILKK